MWVEGAKQDLRRPVSYFAYCQLTINVEQSFRQPEAQGLWDQLYNRDSNTKRRSWDAMDRLPIYSDPRAGQMSRFGYREPFAALHFYSEASDQFSGPDDLALLPFAPEHLTTENFYGDSCGFPFQVPYGNFGGCEYPCSPAFIRKRNERERQRVKCVNEGYAKLRHHLPAEYLEKRISKVETLRAAIKYIRHLQSVLHSDSEKNSKEAYSSCQDGSQNEHSPKTS